MSFDKKQLEKIARAQIYSLVQTINDMFASQNYSLHKSKNEIYHNILRQLDIESGKKEYQFDRAMLESSYEDDMQKQYFQKNLEIDPSLIQQISQGDDGKSVDQNDSMMISPLWTKFGIDQKFKNENQYQVTTYNQQQVDIFDTMVNENQVKLEYQQFTRSLKPQFDQQQDNQSDKQNYQNQNNKNNFNQAEKTLKNQAQMQQQQKESLDDNQSSYYQKSQQSQYSITDQEYLNYKRVLLKSNLKSQENLYSKISRTNLKTKQRKYKSYTQQQKMQAIILAHEAGIQFSSKYYDIPKKNISRWMSNKKKTKQIRGRKPGDPGMQDSLTQWINDKIKKGIYVTQTQIRHKALELSSIRNPSGKSFKASKGWLQKYFKRNKQMSTALSFLLQAKRNNSLEEGQKQMKQLLKSEYK